MNRRRRVQGVAAAREALGDLKRFVAGKNQKALESVEEAGEELIYFKNSACILKEDVGTFIYGMFSIIFGLLPKRLSESGSQNLILRNGLGCAV